MILKQKKEKKGDFSFSLFFLKYHTKTSQTQHKYTHLLQF